jgi:hypothetical protein
MSFCKASKLSLRLIVLGATCLSQAAFAASADVVTGVLNVSATVVANCAVGTSTLAFGTVDSSDINAGNVDSTGNVTVNCTNGVHYTVKLDAGAGTGATFASRKMTSGGNLLNYSIYTSTAHTTVWGEGASGSATVTGDGTSAPQSLSAYGRIFSGQTPPTGAYTDTVNVAVSY